MFLARGVALSLFCAAMGAAGWTAVSVATETRFGWLGIFVGGLAGFGMAMGNKARGGAGAGFLAAAVAAVAIMGSRFAVMHIGVQDVLRAGFQVTPEEAVNEVAAEVHQEYVASGLAADASDEGEYSSAVFDEAQRRWDLLSSDQQESYMRALGVHYASQGESAAGLITLIAVVVDFGLFGFVWLALGSVTAYQIGCMRGEHGRAGEGADPDDEKVGGGGFWARTTASPSSAEDETPEDPLAALGAGMRAEIAADKSDQFRRVADRDGVGHASAARLGRRAPLQSDHGATDEREAA